MSVHHHHSSWHSSQVSTDSIYSTIKKSPNRIFLIPCNRFFFFINSTLRWKFCSHTLNIYTFQASGKQKALCALNQKWVTSSHFRQICLNVFFFNLNTHRPPAKHHRLKNDQSIGRPSSLLNIFFFCIPLFGAKAKMTGFSRQTQKSMEIYSGIWMYIYIYVIYRCQHEADTNLIFIVYYTIKKKTCSEIKSCR